MLSFVELAAVIPAIFPKSESKLNYDDHHKTRNANAIYNDDSPTIDHEDELPPKTIATIAPIYWMQWFLHFEKIA